MRLLGTSENSEALTTFRLLSGRSEVRILSWTFEEKKVDEAFHAPSAFFIRSPSGFEWFGLACRLGRRARALRVKRASTGRTAPSRGRLDLINPDSPSGFERFGLHFAPVGAKRVPQARSALSWNSANYKYGFNVSIR